MFVLEAMRALAILLITNSHLREMYPYSFMATGGMLGNMLFFFISGYGVTFGLGKHPERFAKWYLRRLIRIYVPLTLATFFFLLIGFKVADSGMDALALFVYPFDFWFLPVIALLYLPIYVMANYGSRTDYISAIVCCIILYVIFYIRIVDFTYWNAEDHVLLKTIFYAIPMILGSFFAKYKSPTVSPTFSFAILALFTLLYYGFLIALQRYSLFALQGGAEVIALCWALSFYFACRQQAVEEVLRAWLGSPISFLSAITLECYLLQAFFYTSLPHIVFPANILLFFGLMLPSAWAFHNLAAILVQRIQRPFVATSRKPT